MKILLLFLFIGHSWSENLRWFDPSQGLQDCIIYNQENCSYFKPEKVPVRRLLGSKQSYFGMNFEYIQDYALEQSNYRMNQMSVSNDITFLGETIEGSFFGLNVSSWGSPVVFENTQAGEILEQNTVESAHLIFAQDLLSFWENDLYLSLETRVPLVNSRGIWQSWVRFDIPRYLKFDLGYKTQTHRMEILEGGLRGSPQYYLRASEKSYIAEAEVRWNSVLKTNAVYQNRQIWRAHGERSLGVRGKQSLWKIGQELTWGRLKNHSSYEWGKWDDQEAYYKSYVHHQSTFAWSQSIHTLVGASYGTLYGSGSRFNNSMAWWGNSSLYEDLIWMKDLDVDWFDLKFEPLLKYDHSKYFVGTTRRILLNQNREKWFIHIGSIQKNVLGSLEIQIQIPLSNARINQNEDLKSYETGYTISLETTSQF